ncbi:MAG: glutamate synthase subunit beta [Candidatus Omnitrophica bacterium]|nr:glutamate synthase subunit beta [Candidatus Omnitrophota bacterium]
MGDSTGFMKFSRQDFEKEPAATRIKHWHEFVRRLPDEALQIQGARCMDCGTPFCHWGCPLSNLIPDWNDLVYRGKWEVAIERLHKTNNFPEFTGRVCPAPCENSCVLGINKPAVTIKNIELSIIEKAYEKRFVTAQAPKTRSGKKVAVVGSGPSGLACADQLNQSGHLVTVYEKNEVVGGLVALGIPDYKLEKTVVERRVNRMVQEGVQFETDVYVGVDVSAEELQKKYDAVVLCCGAEHPRDLPVPGRELKGIHFAMEFLTQQNRVNAGQKFSAEKRISAEGKKVVVLGGGDTGADCIGTSNRQGAVNVKNFELLPQAPKDRAPDNPWPQWAYIDRIATSHEEGVERDFCIMTKSFSGENGKVKKLHAVRVEWGEKDPKTGRFAMKEIPGSEFEVEVDLVFLALGFLGPVKSGMIKKLSVDLDVRGNVKTNEQKMTSVEGVFAAGDMRRGQSLVVWAIQEGRLAAEGVDHYLKAQR